jgi:hypothetical protein
MVESLRYIWQLLVLSSLILLIGILFIPRTAIQISIAWYVVTLLSVTGINLVAFLIMSRGIRKNEQGGVVLLLAGMGMKFLLYLLYILVFWLVTKNLTKGFILIFFALYLFFTFLLAIHLLKLLKNK